MKVAKDKIKVTIYTATLIIEGIIHKIPTGRTSDYLNVNVNRFIPITDVKIRSRFPDDSSNFANEVQRPLLLLRTNMIEFVEIVEENLA
ncbi:MAG: hypothetical protein M1371_04560 [Actinobacteria bacterium]|nr:hypothetical protein [Actinomycetota bacterium]